MERTRFEAAMEKHQAVKDGEAAGKIADSKDVRMALMTRVQLGELTLEAAQAELARIKRGAKAAGMSTRARTFSAS